MSLDDDQATADSILVDNWRLAHSTALAKTRVGLGVIVARVLNQDSPAELVGQRLKRFESIVAKLIRDRTRLGEMEDIAGCRSVLPKLELVRVRDYNECPHPGGYRALHLWCRRDGFKVEIQLRTTQDWAEAIEQWDTALSSDLKHEQGPEELLTFFRELVNYYWT